MQRRTFLKTLASSGVVVVATGGGYAWLQPNGEAEALTVTKALEKIDAMSRASVQSTGAWSPFQIFSHIAQSIEYSIPRVLSRGRYAGRAHSPAPGFPAI